MTQEKMRRMITACVSAATVLLVFLLGFLIYQWITIATQNKREAELIQQIEAIERQIEEGGDEIAFNESEVGLRFQLSQLQQKLEMTKKD